MLCVLSPHRLGLPIASLRPIQTPWSKRRVGEGLPVLSVWERSRKFQIVFRKKKKASLIKQADVRTAPVHVQPGASVTLNCWCDLDFSICTATPWCVSICMWYLRVFVRLGLGAAWDRLVVSSFASWCIWLSDQCKHAAKQHDYR